MNKIKVWYVNYMNTLFLNKGEAIDAAYSEDDVSYGELVCDDSIMKQSLGTGNQAYISCREQYSYKKFFLDKEAAINHAVRNGYATEEVAEACLNLYNIKEEEYAPVQVPFEVELHENDKGFYFKKALHPEVTGNNGRKKLYFVDRNCHNELCKGNAVVTSITEFDRFGFFCAEMVKYPAISEEHIRDFLNKNNAYFTPVELYKNTCIGDMLVLKDAFNYFTPYVVKDGSLQVCDNTAKMWYLREKHPVAAVMGYQLVKDKETLRFKKFHSDSRAIQDLVKESNSFFEKVQMYQDECFDVIIIGDKLYVCTEEGISTYPANLDMVREIMSLSCECDGVDVICKTALGICFDTLKGKFTEFKFDYWDSLNCDSYVSDLVDSAVDYGFIQVKTIHSIMFAELDEDILAEAVSDYSMEEFDEIMATVSEINKKANEAVVSKSKSGKIQVKKSTLRNSHRDFMIL